MAVELPKTLKNFSVFVDGVGYAGRVEEGTPPKITLQTEEWQGGGMVAPVDISYGTVDKLETEVTIAEYNPALMGMFGRPDVPITFRGAQGPDAEPVIVECRALLREVDMGSWKAKEKGALKLGLTCTYLKITVAGADVVEVDAVNMIHKAGGVDHMTAVRQALGE